MARFPQITPENVYRYEFELLMELAQIATGRTEWSEDGTP